MIASTAIAYQLFINARMYWDKQRYPHRINYSVHINVHDKAGTRAENFRSAYDVLDGRIWVDAVSDYERSHPARGRGVKFCFAGGGAATATMGPSVESLRRLCGGNSDPSPNQDFIGVPELAPNYSFSLGSGTVGEVSRGVLNSAQLVHQIRAEFHDPLQYPPLMQDRRTQLNVITTVVAYARRYVITLEGEDTIGTHRCYHLVLRPIAMDGRYRLRDLWIDTRTYATIRARIALNFVSGPGTRIPWTINFTDIDGARYIASERADAPYRYAGRIYDRVTIRFVNVRVRKTRMPFILPFVTYLKLREPEQHHRLPRRSEIEGPALTGRP